MSSRLISENRWLVMIAVIVSFVLSAWCIYADPIVNNDGIRYFMAASKFAMGEWSAGFAIYKWPFFSLMIAGLSYVSGLSVDQAAYLLSTLLHALIVVAFMSVIRELGGDRTTIIIAAVIVILFPELNKFRSFIIRDTGYLAFYLLSLVFLVRYWEMPRSSSLIKWFICAIFAFLFRVEGLVFLVLIPMMIWIRKQTSMPARVGLVLVAATLVVSLFACFSLWLFSSEAGQSPAQIVARPLESLRFAWHQIGTDLWYKMNAIQEEFLGEGSGGYAYAVLVVSLVVIVAFETVRRMSIIYAGFAAHAAVTRLAFPAPSVRGLWYRLIGINLALLCTFATVKLFLVGRYTMALALTVLLAAPFSLAALYARWRRPTGAVNKPWLFPIMILLVLVLGIESLDVFTDKRYLREAGRWLETNTPANAKLFSDNQALIYYSGKDAFRKNARYDWPETMSVVYHNAWRQYDYLAIRISRKQPQRESRLVQKLGRRPLKTFANEKGDKVLIFATR